MTAQQPFTSVLVTSNVGMYRHQWVWNKNNSAGFATAKIRPFAICEDILVFGKNKVNYYPQMRKGKLRKKGGYSSSDNYGIKPTSKMCDEYYPKNLNRKFIGIELDKTYFNIAKERIEST